MSFKSILWRERLSQWKLARQQFLFQFGSQKEVPDATDCASLEEVEVHQLELDNEIRFPLSRKVPVPSSRINPYRVIILFRVVILAFFLHYRLTHPVQNAYGLWLASVICEVWFSISWILDQFPKWHPVCRETYPERLCLRYNQPGKQSELAFIDVFVGTVDLLKESPLVIANTVLSVLSVNYPSEKICCYVSDDKASLLTLETLLESCEYAKKWVPFCKKFSIEPRSPESYFTQKADHLKYNIFPTFPKERRLIKRHYEEFKVRINSLEAKFKNVPSYGWTMKDGCPWPGNNTGNHPGMIQILLGAGESNDNYCEDLPRLVYVSREKHPAFQHNEKAGSLNALVRVSALLTNGAYILNLEHNQYINNSNAFLEAMCFMMDPTTTNKVCYVQFPQRFDGVDAIDRYANHTTIFYDANMKGLDGIQGPLCIGSGCFFNRKALYGYDPPSGAKLCKTDCCDYKVRRSSDNRGYYSPTHVIDEDISNLLGTEPRNLENEFPSVFYSLERCFGQSRILLASVLVNDDRFSQSTTPDEILTEAISVISCDYEENTAWGREIGWIYGSQTSNILTGLKMHSRGWRSVYCMPARTAFRGSAPIDLSDRLRQVFQWAFGCIEILLSSHCPIWYGYGGQLKWLERVAYINTTISPLTSIPLLIYCTLPAVLLLTRKFIIPVVSNEASIWAILLFSSILSCVVLESRWSAVRIQEWWRNQQFWVIAGVSSHLFALFQGFIKVLMGLKISSSGTTMKYVNDDAGELYRFKLTSLLVLPTTLILINLWAMVAAMFLAASSGYWSWVLLFCRLFFAFCVVVHLHPFLKGLFGLKRRIPTVVVIWSLLVASLFALFWIRVSPFTTNFHGPDPKVCGIAC